MPKKKDVRNAADDATYKTSRIYEGYSAANGLSTCTIVCGWCGGETEAYKWTLAGGGKKCSHCPAVHASFNMSALKDKDIKKFEKEHGKI